MGLEEKRDYVYHYSLKIMDPAFGHLTVKRCPSARRFSLLFFFSTGRRFLNGHEYVVGAPNA
jgi:hypothetical protein